MYGDLKELETWKARLNSVSPTFCMAKWLHATIHLLSGETHSCYLPPTHKIPTTLLKSHPSALHNTPEKKEQRRMMKCGEKPKGCDICWKVESLPGNQVSDRHLRATETWTKPFFEKIQNLKWDQDVNPTYLELSFSSVCNFKCSYCSPHVSSSWEKDVRENGPYKLSDFDYGDPSALPMPIPEEAENPYIEAFWKWLPDMYHDLMHLRVTGGEPLLSRHTERLLTYIQENPHPELHLSINSNMGLPRPIIEKFFNRLEDILDSKSISTFMLHSSVDTYGAQAEYIRNGLKFHEFNHNIETFLERFPNADLAFMCTFNALSIVGFRDFLDWIKALRTKFGGRPGKIHLDIPHLMIPTFMNIRSLPEDFQKYILEHIDYMESNMENESLHQAGFRENEIMKMKRILETMRDRPDKNWEQTAQSNFYLFFNQHDSRRGTDFLRTFPNMESYWNHCRAISKLPHHAVDKPK